MTLRVNIIHCLFIIKLFGKNGTPYIMKDSARGSHTNTTSLLLIGCDIFLIKIVKSIKY